MENRKLGIFVDFRGLKSVTKFDPYPSPIFEEATSTESWVFMDNIFKVSGRTLTEVGKCVTDVQ